MSPAQPPRRRPWWMLPVFIALLLVPAAISIPTATGLALVLTGWRMARSARRRSTGAAAGRTEGAIVLGTDRSGRPVSVDDRQLSAHGLILGASGAGKSTTLLRVLTDQVRRGLPVVAIDLKGSPAFARELAAAADQSGRRLLIWTPDGPAHWNPLGHGNATELKDKLIATERFTEPHYQRAAERYVQAVLQVLEQTHPGRAPTLDEVVSLMDPHRLMGALRRTPPPLRTRVADYLATLTPDQLSAGRGLATRMAILTESHTGRFLSPAPAGSGGGLEIDLRAALRGGDVVLFSLNSSSYGKLAAQIGTLVVQDLVSAAGGRLAEAWAGGERPQRAVVGIDEFSALGADHVLALLARGREAGVIVLLATQELADLDRAAPGLRDQVMGNTAIKIAHRQDVPASAQTVSQLAGTEKVWEDTHQIAGPFGGYRTGRGTRRAVEQFLVHPNEIKTLRTGEAVVITKLPRTRVRTVQVTPPDRGLER
jgi:conjugal transfer pilus assembly protein TraD